MMAPIQVALILSLFALIVSLTMNIMVISTLRDVNSPSEFIDVSKYSAYSPRRPMFHQYRH